MTVANVTDSDKRTVQPFTGIRVETDPGIAWVARAASKDETRYYMQGLHVEQQEDGKTVAVATDGRRIHYLELGYLADIYAPGEYQIAKITKTRVELVYLPYPNVQFPNWRNITKGSEKYPQIAEIALGKDDGFHLAVAKLIRGINEADAINLDFVKDLSGSTWEVFQDDATDVICRSIKFVADDGAKVAIIAPMSIPVKADQ